MNSATIDIEDIISRLKEEQKKGATVVGYKGTLFTNNGNSIVITTEKQM